MFFQDVLQDIRDKHPDKKLFSSLRVEELSKEDGIGNVTFSIMFKKDQLKKLFGSFVDVVESTADLKTYENISFDFSYALSAKQHAFSVKCSYFPRKAKEVFSPAVAAKYKQYFFFN